MRADSVTRCFGVQEQRLGGDDRLLENAQMTGIVLQVRLYGIRHSGAKKARGQLQDSYVVLLASCARICATRVSVGDKQYIDPYISGSHEHAMR